MGGISIKHITLKSIDNNGIPFRKNVNMRKKLNLTFLDYIDRTMPSEEYEFPTLTCHTTVLPDYIALYTEKNKYDYTRFTATSFYQFDDAWDRKDGFINAFKYNDKRLIMKFKERFRKVRMFIMPDCSMFGDLDLDYNKLQLKRAILGALILNTEFNVVVIPNMTYISENTFPLFFDAVKYCSVIAVSIKGKVRYSSERKLLIAAIKYAVDNMPNLKTFVVYSVCGKDETVYDVFRYAIEHNVSIHIPQNTLRERNMRRCGK